MAHDVCIQNCTHLKLMNIDVNCKCMLVNFWKQVRHTIKGCLLNNFQVDPWTFINVCGDQHSRCVSPGSPTALVDFWFRIGTWHYMNEQVYSFASLHYYITVPYIFIYSPTVNHRFSHVFPIIFPMSFPYFPYQFQDALGGQGFSFQATKLRAAWLFANAPPGWGQTCTGRSGWCSERIWPRRLWFFGFRISQAKAGAWLTSFDQPISDAIGHFFDFAQVLSSISFHQASFTIFQLEKGS